MKKKILSLILVIGVVLPSINLIPATGGYTVPMSEVWQVGDWVSYESVTLFTIQTKFTVISATSDYIEFMTNENISATSRINTTTGRSLDDLSLQENDSYVVTPYPLNDTTLSFSRLNLSVFEEFVEIEPFFYESHALIHVDDSPTVIPVTGVAYEYSNISDTQSYNYTTFNFTDYSSETTLVQYHTNYSVQIEIHEPTGVMVNMLIATCSNITISFFTIPLSIGVYVRLIDSHGVFEPPEESPTTRKTPYGLGLALIGMACIYIRRRG